MFKLYPKTAGVENRPYRSSTETGCTRRLHSQHGGDCNHCSAGAFGYLCYRAFRMHAKSPQSCPTLRDPVDCSPPGSSVLRNSPGKNTGVGCHALLPGIFPTQGLSPGLPYSRWILHQLSYWGSPKNNYIPVKKIFIHLFSREWSSSREKRLRRAVKS